MPNGRWLTTLLLDSRYPGRVDLEEPIVATRMLQIPDLRVLGRMSGGVVVVLRTSKTTRDAVRQRLQADGTRILGTILNDWNPGASPGGYYGYKQGYYASYKSYYTGGQ